MVRGHGLSLSLFGSSALCEVRDPAARPLKPGRGVCGRRGRRGPCRDPAARPLKPARAVPAAEQLCTHINVCLRCRRPPPAPLYGYPYAPPKSPSAGRAPLSPELQRPAASCHSELVTAELVRGVEKRKTHTDAYVLLVLHSHRALVALALASSVTFYQNLTLLFYVTNYLSRGTRGPAKNLHD